MASSQVSVRRMLPVGAVAREEPGRRDPFRGAHIAAGARPLAPRGVGQILDSAAEVFVARFAICVAIGACLMLPVQVGSEIVARSHLDLFLKTMLAGAMGLAAAPAQLMTSAFVCAVVGGEMMGQRVGADEALRVALRRFLGIFVIALLTAAAAMALLCPCGLTTYLGYWLFAAVPAVYVLEGEGLGNAIGRGLKLVWGVESFWRWMGWYVVASAIVLPLNLLSALRTSELTRGFVLEHFPALTGPMGFALAVLEAILMGVGLAYPAVLGVVYYVDLRVRREGLDLEHRLARLEARGGGAAA